jgi:Family of unknown function (DUF6365)
MAKSAKRVLILVVSGEAWGRISIASQIAIELKSRGIHVHIILNGKGSERLSELGISHEKIAAPSAFILRECLEEAVREQVPSSILVCDFASVSGLCRRLGSQWSTILDFDFPVLFVDSVCRQIVGNEVDIFGTKTYRLEPTTKAELLPIVPLADWHRCQNGSRVFQIHQKITAQPAEAKFLLMTTAPWQHTEFNEPWASRTQKLLPALLASSLMNFAGISLVHVGPQELTELKMLGTRYRWVGTVEPVQLEELLRTAMCYLITNPIGSVVERAFRAGLPVLYLHHWEPVLNGRSEHDFPYKFSVWPLGHYQFLRPLLENNPWRAAVFDVEVGDPVALSNQLEQFLLRAPGPNELVARAFKYVDAIAGQPTVVDRILSML